MAVITNKLKKQVIDSIKTDFDNASNRYYIGLGKSEQFNTADTVPDALNHDFEERTFRNALQAIMEVSDFTFVVERENWSAGTKYSAYNDKQVANPNPSYYVMNDENQVYICIQQGKNANGDVVNSTVKPQVKRLRYFLQVMVICGNSYIPYPLHLQTSLCLQISFP